MSMTRAELMAAARDVSDSVDSQRWSDAVVRQWLGVVHWQEFKGILNANNEYTLASINVTENSDGKFLLTALDTGAGDNLLTHYRIQSIAQSLSGAGSNAGPFAFYKQVNYVQYPIPQANAMASYVWYLSGSYVQVLPVQDQTVLSCTVNHLPQRADLLVSDASTVVFPSGYELTLAYMTARHMLMKGGAETAASQGMAAMADEIRQPMLMDLRRPGIGPTIARALDESAQWGGV